MPRSTIDIGRLSAALSRPGIDTTLWLSLAQVTDVGFDGEEGGMFADVVLLPDQDEETCLIGSGYAGDGFGSFVPPKVGDLVLVAVPNGDVGIGPIIISRIWHGTAKPPTEFGDPDTDEPTDATQNPTTVVEPQRTLRVVARDDASLKIEVSGSGKVQIEAKGQAQVEITGEAAVIINSPDVRIGPTAGAQIARVGDMVTVVVPSLLDSTAGPVVPQNPLLATGTGYLAVGQISSGATGAKA